jgi:hypothetical protein
MTPVTLIPLLLLIPLASLTAADKALHIDVISRLQTTLTRHHKQLSCDEGLLVAVKGRTLSFHTGAKCLGMLAALALNPAPSVKGVEVGGVKVTLNNNQGPAVVTAEPVERFKLRVHVAANGEIKPPAVRVELPNSGPNAWPADVEVRDASGKALLVQRTGIEWWQMLVPLPAGVTTCFVQAVEPRGSWPKPTSDKDRAIQDRVSGVKMRIAKMAWRACCSAEHSL